MKAWLAGLGCLGILVFAAIAYIVSVAWWSIWLTLGVRLSGAETWTYWHTCTHWGLLVPLVLG